MNKKYYDLYEAEAMLRHRELDRVLDDNALETIRQNRIEQQKEIQARHDAAVADEKKKGRVASMIEGYYIDDDQFKKNIINYYRRQGHKIEFELESCWLKFFVKYESKDDYKDEIEHIDDILLKLKSRGIIRADDEATGVSIATSFSKSPSDDRS